MPLRIQITLKTSHTTVVTVYDGDENRLVVTELLSPDPRIIDGLREQAKKLGLAPSKAILEANSRTRGGTEELPWALLSNYSLQSQRTQSIVRRSFAEIFAEIKLESEGHAVAYNELSNKGRVRMHLGTDTFFWLDNLELSIFID